jgi:transposase-like protein
MTSRITAPGRADREGLSLPALFRLFPDDAAAERWFEDQLWGGVPTCPDCTSQRATRTGGKQRMPYHCKDCRGYFSVKKGSLMHGSNLGYQTWAIAIYLVTTNLKGVSAMKLHRDLAISYPTAWHLLHRIRAALDDGSWPMDGPIEVDETYVGGKEANKHEAQRAREQGRAPEKVAVVGAKDRETGHVQARVVGVAHGPVLRAFVREHARPGAWLYSDGHAAYTPLDGEYQHRAVQHSAGTYVIERTHTNGIEAFWSMLKRGLVGTYHQVSAKHLQRYVDEFAGRHNLRDADTRDQMAAIAKGLRGKRLRYADLTA